MKKKVKKIILKILKGLISPIFKENLNEILFNQGVLYTLFLKSNIDKISKIQDAEFKVFSQWGDDGIIQYLINTLNITSRCFIEFGVENYLESNTRFLLMNNNWRGLILDGSIENVNYIKQDNIYWKYDLTAVNVFITAENINQIFIENNFIGEVGILHIDIDGNDYWVWKAINIIDPEIVILEYNSILGYERSLTVPYNSSFVRNKAHYSNLYAGSSLLSLHDLSTEKGYSFVGCNSAGNNAYFVRNDKINSKIKTVSINDGYVKSKFRETRNARGSIVFNSFSERENILKTKIFYNTRTNQNEPF